MSSDTSILEKYAKSSDFWQGAEFYEQCITANKHILKEADDLYSYGYELLGFSFSVYLHSVIEKVNELGIDHLIFVAREGYLFEKIYNIIKAELPDRFTSNITTAYAYLSRVSTFLASTPQLTTREIELITYKFDQKGLWSALSYIGLPIAEFEPLAAEHDLVMTRPVKDYWNDHQLIAFLNDSRVQKKVRKYYQQSRNNLYTYLDQCQFWGKDKKVALIDIGWDGTIQDNLVRAFNHLPEFPLLHGLYFGRRNMKPVLRYSGSFSNGLIFDRRDYDITGESINSCATLFEKGAGAPHASTIGHKKLEDGTVTPIFKSEQVHSRKGEKAADASVAVLQQGILDFAQQYAQRIGQAASESSLPSANPYKPFVRSLITRHIVFPTRKEANLVANHLGEFSEDMGEDALRPVTPTAHKLRSLLKTGKLKAIKRAISASTWRAATVKLLGIPGVHFLYVVKRFLVF